MIDTVTVLSYYIIMQALDRNGRIVATCSHDYSGFGTIIIILKYIIIYLIFLIE